MGQDLAIFLSLSTGECSSFSSLHSLLRMHKFGMEDTKYERPRRWKIYLNYYQFSHKAEKNHLKLHNSHFAQRETLCGVENKVTLMINAASKSRRAISCISHLACSEIQTWLIASTSFKFLQKTSGAEHAENLPKLLIELFSNQSSHFWHVNSCILKDILKRFNLHTNKTSSIFLTWM